MSRRTASLVVSALAIVVLVCVAVLVPMPYVVMSPGPVINLVGKTDGKQIITISGRKTYPTKGHLDLTTVSFNRADSYPKLPEILQAWWSPDQIVLPRDIIYPPTQTIKQVQAQNRTDMLDSQSAAVVAAAHEAGINAYPVEISAVSVGEPAQGVLRKGDIVRTVDGRPLTTTQSVVSAISTLPPGSNVTVGVDRAGRHRTLSLRTAANPTDPTGSRIGVTLTQVYDPPFNVHIDLYQQIGGPSGGLMFSLTIYDMLTPGLLNGGLNVAGTGTIDQNSKVGPIGGIQQKIAGAYATGARIFLVPAGDCAEAAGSSLVGSIRLIRVATLDEAVRALGAIKAGHAASLRTCGG